MLWLRTAAAQGARKSQVAVAIALQSVNTKEASNACVNERCKILRSLNRVFVFEIVLCIGAPSKDPARFVDLGFGILRYKEAQEYKSSSQETNHNNCNCYHLLWFISWELDLYSCASLFLKIQNPKSTNLAGSLDGAPIHNTISKTETLFRDRNILQRSFTQAFDASLVFTDCSAIATATCDLRARCAAAVRSHNTTPPLNTQTYVAHLGVW